MIAEEKLHAIFNQDPGIEAIISINSEGLPVHWFTSVPTDIEKITAMAMRMFITGKNLGFIMDDEPGELIIDADFGRLELRETQEQDFLLILTHRSIRKI